MSWLNSLGGKIKDGVVGAGHAVGSVASNPWVQGITAAGLAATGVGAPAAAALLAAQRGGGALLRPGGNIGDAAKGAATGAVMGYGAGKAGSLLRSAIPAIAGAAGGGGATDLPGMYNPETGKLDLPNTSTGGGGIGGALSSAGGFLKDHAGSALGALTGGGGSGGGMSPLTLGLAGLQTANAAQLGNKANDFADKAWSLSNDSYTNRAPLRAAGTAGLLTPRPMQDLSGLTAIRNKNAQARG